MFPARTRSSRRRETSRQASVRAWTREQARWLTQRQGGRFAFLVVPLLLMVVRDADPETALEQITERQSAPRLESSEDESDQTGQEHGQSSSNEAGKGGPGTDGGPGLLLGGCSVSICAAFL